MKSRRSFMKKYLIRLFVNLIPTLIIVSIIVFLVTRTIPGNPAVTLLGPQASAEQIKNMEIEMGLDKPLIVQFFSYIGDLFQGNLGYSYAYNMDVSSLILERFPNTILLSVSALLLALVTGIPAGIISAYKHNSFVDYFFTFISLLGVSMPVFWLGVML